MKVLTELQAIEIQEWIERAKPKLGLSDWVIEVKRSRSPKGSDACIVVNEESRVARTWVSPNFLKMSPHRRAQTMLHELMHIWTQRLMLAVVDASGDNLPQVVRREEERTCDAIARAISFAFDPVVVSGGALVIPPDNQHNDPTPREPLPFYRLTPPPWDGKESPVTWDGKPWDDAPDLPAINYFFD